MQERTLMLARLLIETGAVKFGEFTLTSGLKSPIYIDLRVVPSKPEAFHTILAELQRKLRGISKVDCIVGVATAGIVWASVLAYLERKPLLYIRSERKRHGAGKLVEGGTIKCSAAVIIDDVATTGSSLEKAANALIEEGYGRPIAALVIVDREQGAKEKLARLGVNLYRLITLRELLSAAVKIGFLTRDEASRVLSLVYGESG